MPTEHQTKYLLSKQIDFTGTHEYKRITNCATTENHPTAPAHEWLRVNGLPKKIHCISGNRNNRRQETWRDLRWTNLKTRFAKHKSSFNNPSKRMSTELNKYIWSLKDSNINFRIIWKILKQAIAYSPSSKHCNLCHVGIYFIIFKPHLATLNSVDTPANLCWKISSPLLLHNGTHGNSVVSTVNAV